MMQCASSCLYIIIFFNLRMCTLSHHMPLRIWLSTKWAAVFQSRRLLRTCLAVVDLTLLTGLLTKFWPSKDRPPSSKRALVEQIVRLTTAAKKNGRQSTKQISVCSILRLLDVASLQAIRREMGHGGNPTDKHELLACIITCLQEVSSCLKAFASECVPFMHSRARPCL